jgi:hypothetical protein
LTQPLLEPGNGNTATDQEIKRQNRKMMVIIIGAAVILLLIIVGVFVLLMNAKPGNVAQLRDVFIIFMSLQSLLIGLVLVILLIQLSRLINLLQNEIKPILESTNETVSNLRGTASFLSDNLTEPVIKMNEYLAGLVRLLTIIGVIRR